MTDIVFEASGMLYDKLSRTSRPVYMRMKGHAVDISPPDAGGPPGIWPGPGDPDFPGGGRPPQGPVDPGWGYPEKPVDPGYGIPVGGRPHPEHPIVLPDPPTQPPEGPPDDNGFIKPPPAEGGWAYHQTYAWMYDPPAGAAQPK